MLRDCTRSGLLLPSLMLGVIAACATDPSGGTPTSGSSSTGEHDGAATSSDAATTGDASSTATTTATTSTSTTGADESESTATSSSSTDDSGDPTQEILRVDFEADAVGIYTEDMVASDFGVAPPWNNGLDEGRATIAEEPGDRFLRVTYPAGQYGPGDGGVQFQIALPSSYGELYLSYRVRFAEGFDFVKGGKLPGLVGGSSPTGCVQDTDGFSARMMWQSAGAATQYMYFPEKQNECGDVFAYATDGAALHFSPGTWHTVEHRIVMNTPGEHDGIVQAWFDGALAVDEQAFLLRLVDGVYEIDALYFSTFFGGGDSSWAPDVAQILDYDDFVISTAPIEQ